LFQSMEIVGRETVAKRLGAAVRMLQRARGWKEHSTWAIRNGSPGTY
jgi:hypothetical protein